MALNQSNVGNISGPRHDVDKECAVDCNFAFVTEIFKIVNNPFFKPLASSGIRSQYIEKIIFGIQSSRMIGEEIRKYLR